MKRGKSISASLATVGAGLLLLLPAHAAEPVGAPRLTVVRQDWGNPSKGKSVLGTPLRIGAETFTHGIGVNANSIMVLDLPRPATRFQAKIGVDANPDTEKGQGSSSVVFMVIAGNKRLYRSPVLRTEMGAVAVDVSLKGVRVRPDQRRAFALRLRLPAWCKQPTVQVNNEAPMKELQPGKWALIQRDWTGNDTVRLELPMTWRWVAGRSKQTGLAALMRGPLVYHLDPARSGESVRKGVLDLVQPDPLAVGEPQPDTALHPAGRSTRVRQQAEGDGSLDATSDELIFVPYADPGGRRLWFELSGDPDEIVSFLGK